MAHAEDEIMISKPVEVVFNFLADGKNNLKWRSGVVSIELSEGSNGQAGAIYKQVLKGPGGRNIDGDYKITKVIPNQELSFVVIAGPARPVGTYLLNQGSKGTKVKFILDFHPQGFAKLLGPMIQKTMNNEVAQLSKLKQVLEG